jgi:hypothetical protein
VDDKTFTPEEANSLLPELKLELLHLQVLTRQYESQYRELQRTKAEHRLSDNSPENEEDPFFEEESRLEFMRIEVDLLMANFERKGVLLKMIHPGLIDFPAVIQGESVLICWREGEEHITHYHGWDDGFVGRRPLPDSFME